MNKHKLVLSRGSMATGAPVHSSILVAIAIKVWDLGDIGYILGGALIAFLWLYYVGAVMYEKPIDILEDFKERQERLAKETEE